MRLLRADAIKRKIIIHFIVKYNIMSSFHRGRTLHGQTKPCNALRELALKYKENVEIN